MVVALVVGLLGAAVPAVAATVSDNGDGTASGQGGNVGLEVGLASHTSTDETLVEQSSFDDPEVVTSAAWANTGPENFAAPPANLNCNGVPDNFWGMAWAGSAFAGAGGNSFLVNGDTTPPFDSSAFSTTPPDTLGISSRNTDECQQLDADLPDVQTTYRFFDEPWPDGMLVTRTFRFSESSNFNGPLAAYVVRPPVSQQETVDRDVRTLADAASGSYSQVLWPSQDGTLHADDVVNGDAPDCGKGCDTSTWTGTWFADNDPATNSGVLVVRDPDQASPFDAMLTIDEFSDQNANLTGIRLLPPAVPALRSRGVASGWTQDATESEYVCFYNATTWPVAARQAGGPIPQIPVGCPAVPRNLTPPSISPNPQPLGQTDTANPGTWTGSPTSFDYQWLRCDSAGANCTPIDTGTRSRAATRALATGPTYTNTSADVGHTLRVTVIAHNAYGASQPATSGPTGVVTAPPVILPATTATTTAPSVTNPTPKPRACASRRHFAIHVAKRHGRITRAVVTRNGKRVRHVKVKIHRGTVDLRGLPKGTFKVRITIRQGKRVKHQTRTYHTCVPRR